MNRTRMPICLALALIFASVAATGLAAVQGVLAGLVWRRESKQGQRIDVSMLASSIAINQWSTVAESGPDAPVVTVTGAPVELLLLAYGRIRVASVDLDGTPADVEALRTAMLGIS